MICHLCDQEAVERCYMCGELFCERHGKVNCVRCQTAIRPGDRRADRISALPLSGNGRPAWWRPQEAEDYEPPSCYVCQALARQQCGDCGKRYCPEHGGKRGLCGLCTKATRAGNFLLAAVWLGVLVLVFLSILRAFNP